MQKTTNRKESGFTIIEVVLVLAIAGLIFLIVFLALPQLQRSRRDTQRKNDVGRMLSSLESYAGNNSGVYPAAAASGANSFTSFATTYLSDNYLDPTSGLGYGVNPPSTGTTPTTSTFGVGSAGTTPGNFRYATNGVCSGEAIATGSGSRDIAIVMRLETGSYCQDNQ